ncbi:MAG: CDP-alcohol phosphatidyltransferase [Nitrospinaceae bacterium]|nr:MAG: CDP-alcohol phosphatidyltransferase [Nitrospinaceae bacterium]
MTGISSFREQGKERFLRITAPVCRFLSSLGVNPDLLSFTGLLLSMVAGLIYSGGFFFLGGLVLIVAGICDVLDGQMARQIGKLSAFGAFFDSVIDRYSELFVFLGLAWHFAGSVGEPGAIPGRWVVLVIILALSGSLMVSYTRARAEGLGVDCKVGWMQRPERITILVLGSLLSGLPSMGHFIMAGTLLIIAVLSNYTAVQRILHVKNQLAKKNQRT